MKVTLVTKKPMPLIEEDPPSKFERFRNWISKKWIVRRLINPALYHTCRFFLWARLAKKTTYLALLALFVFVLHVAATAFFIKEMVISVAPWTYVRTAKAAEIEWPDIGDCEQYRPVVEKYFGKLTDEALFVAKMESGCIADRVSFPNSDGTKDYCLFQINKEKLTAQSLDVCVRRAFEKYTAGRVGEKNWSAFYAVCDVEAKPKYPKTIKNCD